MSGLPRVVVVTRETDYERLIAQHGTRGQARFWLKSRGRLMGAIEARHLLFLGTYKRVLASIPLSWRVARVRRPDLARFLFEPGDAVLAVGQDGLVANVAKYLDGQLVIGINPAPKEYEGVLVRHGIDSGLQRLFEWYEGEEVPHQRRTMAQVTLDDGQRLLALNEVFIGHRGHQSAKYRICLGDCAERHSSSGLIISTGTGATGWARSVHRQRRTAVALPTPEERRLCFFVREAWPSVATGTDITDGSVSAGDHLEIISEFNDDGVIFGDGIDADCLAFHWGATARVSVAPEVLRLA